MKWKSETDDIFKADSLLNGKCLKKSISIQFIFFINLFFVGPFCCLELDRTESAFVIKFVGLANRNYRGSSKSRVGDGADYSRLARN